MQKEHRTGRFVKQQPGPGEYVAFIPAPLPPDPSIQMDTRLQESLERAGIALGRLDGVTLLLPNPELFLYMYIRKEAVLSSQIEGTQSSLSDLLLFENAAAPSVPVEDVREVSNYIAATQFGLKRLGEGFPLSLRLMREIHGVLMKGTRGGDKTPGEFRRSQNWIGGTRPGAARYVPPPPEEMLSALYNLEKFLHDQPIRTSPLLKAGIAHAQFETIHPFLDGNGRLGRLLITFLLCAEGMLSQPLLYLSLFLKEHRQEYYELLQRIRTEGDWEEWLQFYLQGVLEVAQQATETARRLVHLFEEDRKRIHKIGKGAGSALRVYELLIQKAVISIPVTAKTLEMAQPTVSSAAHRLIKMGILREFTGKRRDRQFLYPRYLRILNEGTEK